MSRAEKEPGATPAQSGSPPLQRLLDRQLEAWLGGQRLLVETFQQDWPSLQREPLVALIFNEIALREAVGEAPQLEEYRTRFPQLEDRFRWRFFAPQEQSRIPKTTVSSAPTSPGGRPAVLAVSSRTLSGSVPPAPALSLTESARSLPGALTLSGDRKASEVASDRQGVPGYEILGELGRGGWGVVYQARHLALDRIVALKMILSGAHAGSSELARFKTEAEAIARLQHPNIVQVYEVSEHDGKPFFSLEFCPGGSLDKKLKGTPLPPDDAARLVEMLARAMHAAHAKHVIHCDLKPANVLLAEDGTPKITDFGLAKKLDEQRLTLSGAIMGTPSYMAPEQAAGKSKELGPPCDIYALGVILYELLTGRPPFRAADVMDTLLQVVNDEPVPPRQLQPKTPRDLETICLKCLEKDRRKRYAPAEALADDLQRFLRREPIRARPTSFWERLEKWARRRPALAALVGVSILALLAVLASVLLFARNKAQQLEITKAELKRVNEQDEVRSRSSQELLRAQQHEAAGRWADADRDLASALAALDAQPDLRAEELRAELLRRRAVAQRQLAVLAARQQAQEQHQLFTRKQDDALFAYGTLFTSMDLQANLQETATAIDEGLGLVGVHVADKEPVVWNPQFSKAELAEITEGCYGLLLILAEVQAQAGSGLEPPKKKAALQQALRTLDRAAQVGTASQAYHLRRARYLDLLGEAESARKESERAQALQPVHAVDFFLLGDEWYKRGRLTEAMVAFERTLRLQPDHFWAQFFLALRYLESQRPAEAKASLTACLSRRPDFPWLYLLRGMVHGGAGEFALAEADFEQALQRHPNPEARYVLWIYRGGMRNRQGKLDQAVADLQQAISLMPDRPQAHESLIQAYLRGKRLDQAAAQLELALRRWPKTASFHRLHARLALARGDSQAALDDFKTAIGLQPPESTDLPDDHLERGRIFFQNKKYADAVEACGAALKLRPDHTEACLTQVRALLELHQSAEAARACDHYLEKGQPVAEIYRLRGRARSQQGDHGGAVDDFSRCLVAGAESDLLVERGWEYFECQAWSLALRDFQEALRLDPEDHYALNGRALGYAYTGQYREAVKDGEAALRRTPDSPVRLYNIACVYALAATKASADNKAADRAELAGRYRSRAVELLQESLDLRAEKDRPSFWRETVQKDTALESIRKEAGYVRLEEQYGKPSP